MSIEIVKLAPILWLSMVISLPKTTAKRDSRDFSLKSSFDDFFPIDLYSGSESIELQLRYANRPIHKDGCSGSSDFFPDYENCGVYFKCTNFEREDFQCPEGQSFFEESQGCESVPCSEREPWPQLPPNFKCGNDSQYRKFQVPGNCRQSYICIWTGTYFTYRLEECKKTFFCEKIQSCLGAYWCPQEDVIMPPDWPCGTSARERLPHPYDCTKFYACYRCWGINGDGRTRCIKLFQCPEGQIFNTASKKPTCIPGKCPVYENVLPPGWVCEVDGIRNVHPTDCKMYYKCYICFDQEAHGKWCYEDLSACGPDEYFDNYLKICETTNKCPQDLTVLPPDPRWQCDEYGEIHRHPDDCSMYYTCEYCSLPGNWCYEATKCPEGKLFDDVLKKCVITEICPDQWVELPVDWNCGMNGEKHVVPNVCSDYYVCVRCERPGDWCYTRHECPENEMFDDTRKICVNETCPQDRIPIPEDFNCTKDGETHMHPQDCSQYYMCIWAGYYFTWMEYQCPEGENFDELTKTCVAGVCPQDLIEIGTGPGWYCNMQGELQVFPEDCSKYFECIPCTRPLGWCYHEIQSCPEGQNFDQLQKQCVSEPCPQDRPEIVEDMECSNEGDEHVCPCDCSFWYICHQCTKASGWCYDEFSCPSGHTYDDTNKKCVVGRCPQYLPKLPDGWNCTGDGALHVIPDNCTSYYTCKYCDDGPWCYTDIETCPPNQTFDDTKKTCVEGRCKQYPEILPPTWTCQKEGENYVNPSDCSSYYTCIMCPDMSTWCYSLKSCGLGQVYDDTNKVCVTGRCPQLPPILPPGWKCDLDGELNVDPNECTRYYTCTKNCPDSTWCHIPSACPAGSTFDDMKKICVPGNCPQDRPELPTGIGWDCQFEGETNVLPTDCSVFYTCYRCKKSTNGWCYETQSCPSGQAFDNSKKMCVQERCPQAPPVLPPGWVCNSDGESNVDPTDCSTFYTCDKQCPDAEWCYSSSSCPDGSNFDDTRKSCVPGPCPQNKRDLPELPRGPGWYCKSENWTNVLPTDCSMFYTCHKCDKPRGWCYDTHTCPSGESFDDDLKVCVAERCPQWPQRLPPNWKCNSENELHADPRDCHFYYRCISCPDGGWCYELLMCYKSVFVFFEDKQRCAVGKCSDIGTTPKPKPKPPQVKPRCESIQDIGKYYPDPDNCYCFIHCKFALFFGYKLKFGCCGFRKWFNTRTAKCEWGSC